MADRAKYISQTADGLQAVVLEVHMALIDTIDPLYHSIWEPENSPKEKIRKINASKLAGQTYMYQNKN